MVNKDDSSEGSMAVTQQVRKQIELAGTDSLIVNNLVTEDLSELDWSGSPMHVKHIGEALEREDIDYLAVRAPNGRVISKGAIDYSAHKGAGTLTQLATMPGLRGFGIGTRLIQGLEDRVRERGLTTVILGVETDNPNAKRLYDRLGYVEYGRAQESWPEKNKNGEIYTYIADIILMRK